MSNTKKGIQLSLDCIGLHWYYFQLKDKTLLSSELVKLHSFRKPFQQADTIKLAEASISISQCFSCCSATGLLWGCVVPIGLIVLAAPSLPRPGSDTIKMFGEDGGTVLC